MEYLLYKFIISFLMAYLVSLIVVNIWNGVEYIWNRLHHNDSEWVDNNTLNEVTDEK